MRGPASLWIIACVLAIAGLMALRACGASGDGPDDGNASPSSSPSSTGGTQASTAAAVAGEDAITAERAASMREAVATLHRYLTALPEADRARADAFWAGAQPPEPSGEADLRTLEAPPRSLRIQNLTPEPLDAEPVPRSLQVPVQLRLGFDQGPLRRYEGWYRLRRDSDGGRWEITSAAIDLLPPRE